MDQMVATQQYDRGLYKGDFSELRSDMLPRATRRVTGKTYLHLYCDLSRLGRDEKPNLFDTGYWDILESYLNDSSCIEIIHALQTKHKPF